ncbi:T6SS effector BTH_I2691 family protein [Pseudomonas wadenswilerensis]
MSELLYRASNEAMPIPVRTCRACERVGLPILPLRAAYAPEPWHTQALPLTQGSEVTAIRLRANQPRTLRRGFLYVLLDRKEWQGYQITPEGALRQIRPYQTPREEPLPLTMACVKQHHDIPASFINFDTSKYSTAWLAIANDPWPAHVLNRYRRGGVVDGMNLEERFYKLDLKTARDDPASIGFAMTEHELQMEKVLEYAQPMAGDFYSVHGFYPRNHRLGALRNHVVAMIKEHKLANGVLALVLPDPIGMVQECNAQRLVRYQQMMEWRAEPQRSFEHLTSQALLGIQEFQAKRAKALAVEEAKNEVERIQRLNSTPPVHMAPLPVPDLEEEKEKRTAENLIDARKRLDDRYNEKARSEFQRKFDNTLAAWQRLIDHAGEQYASHFESPAFQLASRHDYSVDYDESVVAFICMVGQCLAGGPTGVIDEVKLEATQRLWKQQLEDQNSLLHQALHARDPNIFQQVANALTDDERTRIYHGIKTLITTQKGTDLMRDSVKAAAGQMLAGAATASNTLGKHISEHTRALVGHLHREAWLRFSGVEVTQVTVALKAGEYLTLLNETLYEGTERHIRKLNEQFRNPAARKVRAMLLSGHFTPALAGLDDRLIHIKLWTMESAEALRARLETLQSGIGDGVDAVLRPVHIDTGTLKAGLGDFTRQLSLDAEVARLFVRDTMGSMRNAVLRGGEGAFNLGLALGSLWFQQDALRKSYKNMLEAFGDERPEAVAAFMAASVGNLGVGVELVGGTIQMFRPDWMVNIRSGGGVESVKLGGRILQFGSAIAAVATAVEGLQYALAAGRAHRAGDRSARTLYAVASGVAVASALAGGFGSLASVTVLLIPLAAAVLLGLAAFGLAVWAKGEESQTLELWARHSLWGLPEEHRRWTHWHEMDMAIGALNAALLGLTADLEVTYRDHRPAPGVPGKGGTIDYRFVLPGYLADKSRYEWTLRAYRPSDPSGGIVAGGRTGEAIEATPAPGSWRRPGYEPKTSAPMIHHDIESKTVEIRGSIAYWGVLEFHALELEVSYWPDQSDESGVARFIVKEDKIPGRPKW